MNIKLEQIDELIRRTNVGYEEAKEALEKCEGDMLEAIIYLEKNNKIKREKAHREKGCLWDKIKALVNKGNQTRFVVRKEDRIVLNLSLNISILIALFAFHVTAVGLVLALVCGFRMKFETDKGEAVKVNQTLDKVQDSIQNIKKDILSES
jgi:arginyl-tRNA synthetase